MARNNDKTKKYKIDTENKDVTKKDNTKKMKKVKKQKKHPKLRKFIKIFIILCILLFLTGMGVFAAIFFGDTWSITKEDLTIKMQNSIT